MRSSASAAPTSAMPQQLYYSQPMQAFHPAMQPQPSLYAFQPPQNFFPLGQPILQMPTALGMPGRVSAPPAASPMTVSALSSWR